MRQTCFGVGACVKISVYYLKFFKTLNFKCQRRISRIKYNIDRIYTVALTICGSEKCLYGYIPHSRKFD